ncbi:MAG: hypothetical protein HC819_04820 [Cyclobacteriaceae bacterium]|nr:hypothetical protein [Cyclobacteriaceae bacterium]
MFLESLGINATIFSYVVLPLLIFFARIADVSINTIRIIFVMNGNKFISTILGFFESLIWLVAIGQIFQHLNNWVSYVAYPGGFAMGILVGMIIEERMALGKVVVRAITSEDLTRILSYMVKQNMRYTVMSGESSTGNENIVFTVVKRDQLQSLIDEFNVCLPQAMYTVESVKKASEAGLMPESPSRRGIGSWLSSIKRK